MEVITFFRDARIWGWLTASMMSSARSDGPYTRRAGTLRLYRELGPAGSWSLLPSPSTGKSESSPSLAGGPFLSCLCDPKMPRWGAEKRVPSSLGSCDLPGDAILARLGDAVARTRRFIIVGRASPRSLPICPGGCKHVYQLPKEPRSDHSSLKHHGIASTFRRLGE